MGSSSPFVKRKSSSSTRAGKSPAKPVTITPDADAARNHRCRVIANEWRFDRLRHDLGLSDEGTRILDAIAHLRRGIEIIDRLPDTCRIGGSSPASIALGLREAEQMDQLVTQAAKWLLDALASTKDTGGVK
jgi:hypothetical protein